MLMIGASIGLTQLTILVN